MSLEESQPFLRDPNGTVNRSAEIILDGISIVMFVKCYWILMGIYRSLPYSGWLMALEALID